MWKKALVITLVGVVSSCNLFNRHYTKQLKDLDTQLEQYPRLVLDSLKKINPDQLNEYQQAYFYLLSASATDKNFIYLDNDSTLRIAAEYFEDHDEYYNLSRCQYYLGKYAYKRKKIKEAYKLYKNAETNYKQDPQDQHLLGLIYYQLGLIQKQQNNPQEAKTFFQKSYDLFIEVKDTINACYALRYRGCVQGKDYQAAEKDLFQSLKLISSIKERNSTKVLKAQNTILSAISQFYSRNNNLPLSIKYGKECILSTLKRNEKVPSEYYCNLSFAFYKSNELDSAKYYCHKMIEVALSNENDINLSNGYYILSYFEEKQSNYKEACRLKNHFNKLKDSLNEVRNSNNILELEKKYDTSEAQRLLLKAENKNLKAYSFIIILGLISILIGLIVYHRMKKLKIQYERLSEEVKHTGWGFLVTKEFINENHVAYDELERILNREKGFKNINDDLYNKLHEVLFQQKANYLGCLFDRLTSFDGNFGSKFQQLFPDCNTDELLMASMIHHKWKITDMTAILHSNVEAIRKRKSRLATKISNRLKKTIDLDEFLTNL